MHQIKTLTGKVRLGIPQQLHGVAQVYLGRHCLDMLRRRAREPDLLGAPGDGFHGVGAGPLALQRSMMKITVWPDGMSRCTASSGEFETQPPSQ